MNEKNKRQVYGVYDMLCIRDREWKRPKMLKKFKDLYLGWRTVELRHNVRSHLFYTQSWQRGWLPEADFERFKNYAMQ